MAYVNIVTSDRGWILERLATEITSRYSYVVLGEAPDPEADINYYMTYSTWRRKVSPIEIGYFAHYEPAPEASAHFFKVAQAVDHCICHATRYERLLRDSGIENVTTVSPGVDLDRFVPRVKIGIVGRTYHTGRKGEHLIAAVMDIPDIEWHFTGEGWPLPAKRVAEEDLPAFYRDMDFILVSSLYEGGPMCVAEALACGTPIIGPDVGWVPEFPHIPFKLGDAEDLRRVLLDVIAKKKDLRRSVLDLTWDAWAAGHDKVFTKLLGSRPTAAATVATPTVPRRIGLLLHGSEGTSPGGPTVRVPRLARELRERGRQVSYGFSRTVDVNAHDLLHYFNVWGPESAVRAIRHGKSVGKPVVFSPIFLDLADVPLWQVEIPKLFDGSLEGEDIDIALAQLRREWTDGGSIARREAQPGFHGMVREMLARADHVIFLSEFERRKLGDIGATTEFGTLVRNPIDSDMWRAADPNLFKDAFGISDYVLCVARMEPRKNQIMLLHALRDTDLPIVLLGHRASPFYYEMLRKAADANPNIHIIDRLEPNSPMLASAVAGARVFTLPSWAEGAPLSALEAAATGVSLVLSSASGENEYFEERARYCDPGNPGAMRDAILAAYGEERSDSLKADQREFIADRYSWAKHVDATQQVYAEVLARASARPKPTPVPAATEAARRPSIVMDVTTSANRVGRWTGIARVEMAIAKALQELDVDVSFVAWHDPHRSFIPVPASVLDSESLAPFVSGSSVPVSPIAPPPGSYFVIAGSGWMQSTVYTPGVIAFASRYALLLSPVIFDIIPTKFPFWFGPEYAPVFVKNFSALMSSADVVVAGSQSTRQDIVDFAAQNAIQIPDVQTFRLGDEIEVAGEFEDRMVSELLVSTFGGTLFVLSIGAIHKRKNQGMLCDLWIELRASLGSRCPKLVIVGGVAWNGEDVARRIKEDQRLSDLVVILDDVDDESLEWLYANCLFTVYPSLYEGWGLPVGESLRNGKICLASKVSSIPEIAPDFTDLIDPLDFAAWLTKLRFYAGSAQARAAREDVIKAGYRSRTWKEAAGELLSGLANKVRSARPYAIGSVMDFAKGEITKAYGTGGWHPSDRWGCWTADETAGISIALSTPPLGSLVLLAKVNHLQSKAPFACDVYCNGRLVAGWQLITVGLQLRTALIPMEALGSDGVLQITFRNHERRRPSDMDSARLDRRLLGIGIAELAVVEGWRAHSVATYFDKSLRTTDAVELGTTYNFVSDKAAHGFLVGSLITNYAWGVREAGDKVSIRLLALDRPLEDLQCNLAVRPVATATHPVSIKILVNGTTVGQKRFTSDEAEIVSFPIPVALRAKTQPMSVEIIGRATASPLELGLGLEKAKFKLGLLSLQLTSETLSQVGHPYRIGDVLRFDPTQVWEGEIAATPYMQWGWNKPESGAVWTGSRSATLSFSISEPTEGAFLVVFEEAPTLFSSVGSTVNMLLNGQPVLPPFGADNPHVMFVEPGRLNRFNTMTFETKQTASPFKVDKTADERRLGVRLNSLALLRPRLVHRGESIDFSADDQTEAGRRYAKVLLQYPQQDPCLVFRLVEDFETLPIALDVSSLDASSGRPVVIDVIHKTSAIAQIRLGDAQRIEVRFSIPREIREIGDIVLLTLHSRIVSADTEDLADAEDKGAPDASIATHKPQVFVHRIVIDPPPVEHDVEARDVGLTKPEDTRPFLRVDDPVEITLGHPGVAALGEGWHVPEHNGTWSAALLSTMSFRLQDDLSDKATLSLTLMVFGTEHEAGLLSISVNDERVFHESVSTQGFISPVLPLPKGLATDGLTIGLSLDRVFSPAQIGGSPDARTLGLMVSKISLHDKGAPLDEAPEPHVTETAEPETALQDAGAFAAQPVSLDDVAPRHEPETPLTPAFDAEAEAAGAELSASQSGDGVGHDPEPAAEEPEVDTEGERSPDFNTEDLPYAKADANGAPHSQ